MILIKKEEDFLSSSFFYKKIPLQFGMVSLIGY
jgi:hypothetical protein